MFRITTLNVNFGDSIILETVVDTNRYFSIIDCKSVGNQTPTVEFLKSNNIKHLQTIFLTHLHQDHYSGFPTLLKYLKDVNGTLEYFVSPQIPTEISYWRDIISLCHDETAKKKVTAILKSLTELEKLPAQRNSEGKTLPIRMNYEGNCTETAWREDLHPGICFAPVSPTPSEAFRLVSSGIRTSYLDGKFVNAISHAFLCRYKPLSQAYFALSTGDLDSTKWRFVKNRCIDITQGASRSSIRLLKAPHHGTSSPSMEKSVLELINKDTPFVVSISCPPGDPTHPNKKTLDYFSNNFPSCCIVCTNLSPYCLKQDAQSEAEALISESPKVTEFIDFAYNDRSSGLQIEKTGVCAGAHSLEITGRGTLHLRRSSGVPCSYNPGGCDRFL